MATTVEAGDRVLLRTERGRSFIVTPSDSTVRVPGLGVIASEDLVGKPWGSRIRLGPDEFWLLRPIFTDRVAHVERGAQIVLPKDAARIVYETGVAAGSRVLEAGVGSGALTMVLAHAVAPTGRVFAYDLREDHLKQGRRNVAAAELDAWVEFRVGDVSQGVPEAGLDAVVLDLPEPEKVVDAAWAALGNSGAWASYSPLVIQMERTVAALRERGFLDVRCLEILERAWKVHDRGSRPETEMLAHTGFLTFARRP